MKKIFVIVALLSIMTSCGWFVVASDTVELVDQATNPQEQSKDPCPCPCKE